jgi:integrase
MSLYKQSQSNNWWIKIYVHGRMVRVSTGTPDESKAQNIERTLKMGHSRNAPIDGLHRLLDEIAGRDTVTDALPLDSVLDAYKAWLHTTRKKISRGSMLNRTQNIKRFVAWAKTHYTSATSAERVDKACAMAFAKHLVKEGLKDKTRKNILGDLSAIWGAIMRCTDAVTLNPWKLVRPDVLDSTTGKPFSAAQVEELLMSADECGHGWGLACRIALYTGLRYGDVATLEWEDISFEKLLISVTPSKTDRHHVSVVVPVAPLLAAALSNAREEEGPVLPEMEIRYPKPHPECPFAVVLKNAGLDPEVYTFHSWRHTFRTRLGEAGVAKDIAKRLGGWTNDSMADHYDHSERIEELRAAVAKI